MIVKSSFSKGTGKGTGSLSYISREGAFGSGHAPVYDREGNIIPRDDFKELKQEIKELKETIMFIKEKIVNIEKRLK